MSDNAKQKRDARLRRHRRVRKHVRGTPDRPRLAVFRSNSHISAQVIDDVNGRTLASASTVEATVATGGTADVPTPPPRSAGSSPSGPRPQVSTRSSSTGVGSSTTAGSRPSPMPPEKQDWSSDGPERLRRHAP